MGLLEGYSLPVDRVRYEPSARNGLRDVAKAYAPWRYITRADFHSWSHPGRKKKSISGETVLPIETAQDEYFSIGGMHKQRSAGTNNSCRTQPCTGESQKGRTIHRGNGNPKNSQSRPKGSLQDHHEHWRASLSRQPHCRTRPLCTKSPVCQTPQASMPMNDRFRRLWMTHNLQSANLRKLGCR